MHSLGGQAVLQRIARQINNSVKRIRKSLTNYNENNTPLDFLDALDPLNVIYTTLQSSPEQTVCTLLTIDRGGRGWFVILLEGVGPNILKSYSLKMRGMPENVCNYVVSGGL